MRGDLIEDERIRDNPPGDGDVDGVGGLLAGPHAHLPSGVTGGLIWAVLVVWTGLWGLLAARGGAYSWHYFAQGADLLTHPRAADAGLHLYAAHPDLQIGPLALLTAIPLHTLGPWGGTVFAPLLLTLLGPVILKVLVLARQRLTGAPIPPLLLLSTGLFVLPVWCQVATHFTHLDDALALAFASLAVWAVVARRPCLTGLLLAAAIDSKPWAVGFIVLILALPARDRIRSATLTAVAVALAWLPFILADPRTLAVGRFTIDNVDNSALRALGVHTANTPTWDRPAQLILALAVAVLCIRRGRWAAVPLAVVTARLLLDPQTYPYYSSGLLVCAAILDLLTRDRRLPIWTAAAAVWYITDQVASGHMTPGQVGLIRALYCATVLAALCLLPTVPSLLGRSRVPARSSSGP